MLKFFNYVNGINDTPFPNEKEQLVIYSFKYEASRMGGAPSISATAKHRLCLDDYWNDNVYVEFRGEKYFIINTPSSKKDNKDERYTHEIELLSERELLNHVYFIDAVQGDSSVDVYKSNTTKVIFTGDIKEFVGRLNASLSYQGLDYHAVIDEGISSEDKTVEFEDKYILEALQEEFNIYEIPYYFVGKVIHFGYTKNTITYPLKYGFDDALLSISKNNANYAVINKIKGVGSSDNIPYYYPNESDDRSEVEASGKKWITPSPNLMPSIYRESGGANQFYEAKNNTYPDGEGGYYVFENEYSDKNQRQGTTDFDEIKPTIKGATNSSGQRIDMFIEFAYDKNDNDEIDEEGNYIHSYFFGKLRKFDGTNGFNLFEHAIESQAMQISFTSGACGACNFEIGVGEESQKNIVQVDENGDLMYDEETGNVLWENQSPQDRQNDTKNYEVWIALKKDDTTYGQVMPNATQNLKPSTSDTFVILGIDLPLSYITAAEKRLDDSLIKYMWMNNREKFTFDIDFSRIFFEENPEILSQLDENSRVLIEYNGKQHTLYIDNFTYNEDGENILPEIKISLVEELTIGKNSLQTQLDSVKQDILSIIGSADFLKQGLKYFLRKDINDVASGRITFAKGLISVLDAIFGNGKASITSQGIAKLIGAIISGDVKSDNFLAGALGTGYGLLKYDQDGKSYLEIDKLFVRLKAIFAVLEIRKLTYAGGNFIFSPAGMDCVSVEKYDTYYRCYFTADDGSSAVENTFEVDDLVRMQEFNIKAGVHENVSNRYFWRRCVGKGENYIDLSKTDRDLSSDDAPQAGDSLVTMGNKTITSRQNVIMISVYGEGSPSFIQYTGINDYSLDGKAKTIISPELNQLTGKFVFSTSGKDVETAITDAVDGVQIGVRNLLLNSGVEINTQAYTMGAYRTSSSLVPLSEYTLVLCYTLGENNTSICAYDGGTHQLALYRKTGNKVVESITFTYPNNPVSPNNISFYQFPQGTYGSKVHWAVLVEGNKAPNTWIAAPEDIEGNIKDAVDNIQIGSENLISKKMMLRWNEKSNNIAVWGEDDDGLYLDVDQSRLFANFVGSNELRNPIFDIKFKENTQYVLSVEWKLGGVQQYHGLSLYIVYTDGSADGLSLGGNQITKVTRHFISEEGKTIDRISSSFGGSTNHSFIYNISLVEGNKPLGGFPVAAEDQVGANNVNLADGTKEFTITAGDIVYAYKRLYMQKVKPNSIYYVNCKNIENLSGSPEEYSFCIYDINKDVFLSEIKNYKKSGGILITKNNFSEQEGYLLCYAGLHGQTAGNTVKFTELMLVEGTLPAPVWTPSFNDQQTEIDVLKEQSAEFEASINGLTSRVEATETTVQGTREDLDNLQIGGRNYIKNSRLDNLTEWGIYNAKASVETLSGVKCVKITSNGAGIYAPFNILNLLYNLVADTNNLYVTSSVDIYSDKQINVDLGIERNDGTKYVLNETNKWVRISTTQKINIEPHAFIIYPRDTTATVYVKNAKLEIGNKATDWTPAPEDLETKIEENKSLIEQKADEISLSVSQEIINKKGNGNNIAKCITENLEIDGGINLMNDPSSAGKVFTLSIETSESVEGGTGTRMMVHGYTQSGDFIAGYLNRTSETKQKLTFTMPENATGGIDLYASEAWSGKTKVTNLKLEYGDTATVWTPSVKDQEKYVDNKTYTETILDLTGSQFDQNKYYPVTIEITAYNVPIEITITSPLGRDYGVPGWSELGGGFSCEARWTVNNMNVMGVDLNSYIKRNIERFQYDFTEEDAVNGGKVIPLGSIGNLMWNPYEYVYLRGGAKYKFLITNNLVPVLHETDATIFSEYLWIKTSVEVPQITNVNIEQFESLESNIQILSDKITATSSRVTDVESDLGQLTISYNQISGTVTNLNSRLGVLESAGFIVEYDFVTIFAKYEDDLGDKIVSSINVAPEGVSIDAAKINLNGAITANGNVQITTDGNIIAKNAEIEGTITSSSGNIGGWEIKSTSLRSSIFEYPTVDSTGKRSSGGSGSLLSPDGGLMLIPTGNGILAPSTGLMQAGLIRTWGSNAAIIGLEIDAKQTNSGLVFNQVVALRLIASHANSNPSERPRAIEIVDGDIIMTGNTIMNGLALNVRTISSSSGSLTKEDDIVFVNYSSSVTISLPSPSSVKKGKMFFIRKTGSGNITITGTIMMSWTSTTSRVSLNNGKLMIFINHGSYWTQNTIGGEW